MKVRWGMPLGAALLGFALGGCVAGSAVPAETGTPVVVPSGLSPAPTDVPELLDDGTTASPRPRNSLTLDDSSRTSALALGAKVMTLFARPNISAEQWIADLTPYLSAEAAFAYDGTDPARVPVSEVTGPAKLTPASTAMVARVSIPTDDGIYLVILARTGDDPNWRADRIMAPEGTGEAE